MRRVLALLQARGWRTMPARDRHCWALPCASPSKNDVLLPCRPQCVDRRRCWRTSSLDVACSHLFSRNHAHATTNSSRPADPNLWTESDVAAWAEEKGLTWGADILEKNDVNGKVLLTLTDDDMKELGITSFGWRRSLRVSGHLCPTEVACSLRTRHSWATFSACPKIPAPCDALQYFFWLHGRRNKIAHVSFRQLSLIRTFIFFCGPFLPTR